MKKRVVLLFVTLLLLLTSVCVPVLAAGPAAWDGSVASSFRAGSGTRDNPYLIYSPEELALFRNKVNSGQSGLCAKMVADVDLNNREWTPIGTASNGYTGIFDGGGWAVKNMRIGSVSGVIRHYNKFSSRTEEYQVAGLFGLISSGGTVRCVNVSGQVSINKTCTQSTGVYVGAIAGFNMGTIEECFTTCAFTNFSLKNNDYIGVGGVVGMNRQTLINCFNTGSMDITLTASKSNLNHYVGGIVGYCFGDGYGAGSGTYNCYNAAPMNINSNASRKRFGGVAGVEKAVTGFSNNYYDKEVCTTVAACVGVYEYEGTSYYDKTPYGSNGFDTWTMHTHDFANQLLNAYSYDYEGVNKGYPVLSVMNYQEENVWSEWFDDEVLGTQIDQEIYDRVYPAELMNKDLTKPITRVEFAAVAVKLYEEMGGEKLVASELTMPFTDTNSDVVMKAYTIGIVKGISDTEFDPYSKISRQDLATMLTRVYKSLYLKGWTIEKDASYKLDYEIERVFADDADISDYAKPSVYFMVDNKVIKGLTETTFGPRNVSSRQEAENYANASREQALIMAVRSFKNLQK